MAITIQFSPETERKLLARAAATGKDVDTLVREAVEERLEETLSDKCPSKIEQSFLDLARIWKRERGPYSSSARLAEHPAYQQIIALGGEAILLLLRELEHEPDHWFRALYALTGANPVPPASQGNIKAMAEAWLRWGREQGYRW
jgi:hypothetical protein